MSQETAAKELKLRGHALIAEQVKRLPNSPGVYRMLNAKGDVLYVGKARDLKKRVVSYARKYGHATRIKRMIAETVQLVVVVTASEIEALLLEANYIKRFKPRYNVLFRDDKSFPDILLRTDHPYPQILKHRGARKDNGRYFGPFASGLAVNRTLNTLQRAFLLRSCSDAVFESRTRPCLLHQIKRCSAPCVKRISDADYADLVKQAELFLSGRSTAVQEALAASMEEASDQFKYEQAASLRDRIRALTHVQANQGVNPSGFTDADIFAVHEEGGHSAVQVFFFRAGQNWGNRCYFPRHDKSFGAKEILASFLAQFYDSRVAPKLVLLSHDIPDCELLARALSLRMNYAVEISAPKRGEKLKFVEQAKMNAREELSRRMAENASQRRLLEGVAEAFALDAPPRRIEVYDNSHISGANALGALIVAGPEGFEKKEYRKYNIKSDELAPGDDYAMLREVLTRRFKRLANAEPGSEDDQKRPDLVLIDGGPGQLAVARQALADSGAGDIALAAIAKGPERDAGREHFHLPGREPFRLEPRDPVLFYLQRLRDEAHRFAIGGHRKKRASQIGVNPLDEIEGVGGRRKRALLNHFGSARAVADAKLSDLEAVPGISKALARKIHDHFHER